MKNIHTSGDIVVSVVPYHKGQVFTILEGFVETPTSQVCCKLLNLETGEIVEEPQHWFELFNYDLHNRMLKGESACF